MDHILAHPFGMLNDLSIEIDHIKRPIRACVHINRTELCIRGRQKFLMRAVTARRKTGSFVLQYVHVNKVADGFGHESDMVKRRREIAPQVVDNPASRSHDTHIGEELVLRITGNREHFGGRAMIRHVLGRIGNEQIRIAVEIRFCDHLLKGMIGIIYQKMMTPGIKRVAKLCRTGGHLKSMTIGPKANGPATRIDSQPWLSWMVRIIDSSTRISKFLLVTIGANSTFVSEVNPIVDPQQRIVEIVLRV